MAEKSVFKKNRLLFRLLLLALMGCASSEKKNPCPSEEEQPISVCRAREKCESQTSSVGLGVGVGFGRFGVGLGRSQATDRYERCLNQELEEQQSKAQEAKKPLVPVQNPADPEKGK